MITNLAGEIEYVNDAFVFTSGYARDEVIGRNPRLLKSGNTPKETYAAMWGAITRGQPWKGKFWNRRKDGSTYTEIAIVAPIRAPDGKVTHYLAVKDDITEREKLGAELTRYREHLEQVVDERTLELQTARQAADAANRAKSTFLANMSHEIRTPLNGILGMAYLVRQSGVNSKQAEQLDKIASAGEHLLSIISDVLDLAKIEAGKIVLEDKPFGRAELEEAIDSVIGVSARAKGLRFTAAMGELPDTLRGDRMRLQQALVNYLGNAVKFTENGSVTLSAKVVEEDEFEMLVRFDVVDSGIGIRPEALERLFQPFQQADSSTARKFGGTGLGLVITKHIAALMGGKAGCESTPGAGSRFWFTARLGKVRTARVESAPPVAVTKQRLRAEHAGARVLIVEDDELNREVTRDLLQAVGLVVDAAEDGRSAVRLAASASYAAILMDVQMPEMDGLQATRAIRALPGHAETPIIAMTANVYDDDRAACRDAGMNDFLAKPTLPARLYEAMLHWTPKTRNGSADRAEAAHPGASAARTDPGA
ncbi:MAG: response regulator [Burkholderiales bacterium]